MRIRGGQECMSHVEPRHCNFRGLLDGALKLPLLEGLDCERKVIPTGIKGIQAHCLACQCCPFALAANHGEPYPEIRFGVRKARVQPKSLPKFLLAPIEFLCEIQCLSQRVMTISIGGIQSDGKFRMFESTGQRVRALRVRVELESVLVKVCKSQSSLRSRIGGIKAHGLFDQIPDLAMFGRRNFGPHLARAQQQVVGGEPLRRLRQRGLSFNIADRDAKSACDRRSKSDLDGQNVLKAFVVRPGPDMGAGARIDQLRRDTNLICGPARAALQDITNSELAAHLPYVYTLSLVLEGLVACNHE